jgi:hypothetical protein
VLLLLLVLLLVQVLLLLLVLLLVQVLLLLLVLLLPAPQVRCCGFCCYCAAVDSWAIALQLYRSQSRCCNLRC